MPEVLRRAALLIASAMTIGLLWVAATPLVPEVLNSNPATSAMVWHYAIHLAVFAAFAAAWSAGLPGVDAPHLAAALVAFGFLHEAIEIVGHDHGFELDDAAIDALGAILGVIAVRFAGSSASASSGS